MIGEMAAEQTWAWTLAWQSTACVAVGLGGSFIWRHRPARAHRVLLLAMIAAVVVPVLSQVVKQCEWGLFEAAVPAERVLWPTEPPTAATRPAPEIKVVNEAMPVVQEAKLLSDVATAPASVPFDWLRMLCVLWAMASGVLLVRLAVRFALGVRLVRRAARVERGSIATAIAVAREKLRTDQEIEARRSGQVRSPMIWCWGRRPIVLVPAERPDEGNRLDLVGIVCHELAHWKRRDHVTGLLGELIMAALPWQAMLWWARRRLVRLSEEACDDWVVACGHPGVDYVETLLTLTPHGYAAAVPAVVSSRNGLMERIQRILKERCAAPRVGGWWSVAVAVLISALGLGIAFAQNRPAAVARTLTFPTDRVLGAVYVRDPNAKDWYEGWEDAGEARGQIAVPTGAQVKLTVSEEAAADLSPLVQLGADDVDMLDFGWKGMAIGSLAPIGHLTGLRALNLQCTQFDSAEFRYLTGLSRLEVLRLGDYTLSDASMEYVGQLRNLRSLALWGTGISDEGLRHLQGLTKLTFLALNRCDITDEGLRYLRDMTALEGLQIYDTKISDEGLVRLQHLRRLKHIKLGGNGITDAGMKHLEALSQLENVWIDRNPITDEGLASLSVMEGLKELYVSGTEITDAGLAHLAGLPALHHVLADGIGDEGVAYLSTLPSMRMLQIHEARVSEASVASFQAMASLEELLLSGDTIVDELLETLREALPGCKVWDPQRSREYPMPAWRETFEAVYRLEEGEIIKRIAPPFIPERMDYYREELEFLAKNHPQGVDHMTFHWVGKLKLWGMGFGRSRSLGGLLNGVLGLRRYEYEGPEELLGLELGGDWIIRNEMPDEVKLAALADLTEAELGRKIRFEKRRVEREVVVATGRFTFHPPIGTYENTSVHIYADQTDRNEGAGGGTAGSVSEFVAMLGDVVNMPVVDKTEPGQDTTIPYRHHRSSFLYRETDEQERARKLGVLLDHLTEQTELEFEVARQPVEVWFVSEEGERVG
jgi:beta-lactamase regulating signal transducer with metallopeptidase domain